MFDNSVDEFLYNNVSFTLLICYQARWKHLINKVETTFNLNKSIVPIMNHLRRLLTTLSQDIPNEEAELINILKKQIQR